MEKKKVLLGSLNIDFDKFDEKDVEGKYLFTDEVVSTRRKAVYLPGWNGKDISAVDEQLTCYTKLPIICKGQECPFADSCQLVKNGKVTRWLGKACPLEIIESFRHFAGYVNDLDIKSEDYTDIQMIDDLIRLHIHMSRCDKLIRKENPIETMISGVDKRTGLKHEVRQVSQLVEQQRRIRSDINKIYDKLIANRQARMEALSKNRVDSDASNMFAKLLSEANKNNKKQASLQQLEPINTEEENSRMSNLEL